jgi:hypothetical protein
MAIDSREKRQSAGSAAMVFTPPNVTPNAGKDAEWRQQSGWGYSGIATGVPVVGKLAGSLASIGVGI